jgi:hypothetical protein
MLQMLEGSTSLVFRIRRFSSHSMDAEPSTQLEQSFSLRAISSPSKGHLTMSGDIFDCHILTTMGAVFFCHLAIQGQGHS